jgi:hypothetical protein
MFNNGKKADCPLWKGPCREHECRFWTQIMGTHPQTGVELNEWNCAIAFLPYLLIQNSLHERQTGAAVESFRNEMVKQNQQLQRMLIAPPEPPKGDNDV